MLRKKLTRKCSCSKESKEKPDKEDFIYRFSKFVLIDSSANEMRWTRDTLIYLVRHLLKTGQINAYEKIISEKDSEKCICLPRSRDGRIQISKKKCNPQVCVVRMFRYPDIIHINQLVPLSHCQYTFDHQLDSICINPYHLERVQEHSNYYNAEEVDISKSLINSSSSDSSCNSSSILHPSTNNQSISSSVLNNTLQSKSSSDRTVRSDQFNHQFNQLFITNQEEVSKEYMDRNDELDRYIDEIRRKESDTIQDEKLVQMLFAGKQEGVYDSECGTSRHNNDTSEGMYEGALDADFEDALDFIATDIASTSRQDGSCSPQRRCTFIDPLSPTSYTTDQMSRVTICSPPSINHYPQSVQDNHGPSPYMVEQSSVVSHHSNEQSSSYMMGGAPLTPSSSIDHSSNPFIHSSYPPSIDTSINTSSSQSAEMIQYQRHMERQRLFNLEKEKEMIEYVERVQSSPYYHPQYAPPSYVISSTPNESNEESMNVKNESIDSSFNIKVEFDEDEERESSSPELENTVKFIYKSEEKYSCIDVNGMIIKSASTNGSKWTPMYDDLVDVPPGLEYTTVDPYTMWSDDIDYSLVFEQLKENVLSGGASSAELSVAPNRLTSDDAKCKIKTHTIETYPSDVSWKEAINEYDNELIDKNYIEANYDAVDYIPRGAIHRRVPRCDKKIPGGERYPSLLDNEYWIRILYFEKSIKLGDSWHGRSKDRVVFVDGYTTSEDKERFSFGVIENVNRDNQTVAVRKQVGRGLRLEAFHNGHVTLICESESPLFVQSPIYNAMKGEELDTVVRITKDEQIHVFDEAFFNLLCQQSYEKGFDSVYRMQHIASLRVSMVKGWGEAYHRRTVLETPVWLEIQLTNPMSKIDMLLQRLPEPIDGPTSWS